MSNRTLYDKGKCNVCNKFVTLNITLDPKPNVVKLYAYIPVYTGNKNNAETLFKNSTYLESLITHRDHERGF